MKYAENYAPRLIPAVVIAPISEGEVVVATPDSSQALLLNDTAAIVVSLCNGKHSVREIAALFCEAFGLEIHQAEDDVRALLASLEAQGLLASDD